MSNQINIPSFSERKKLPILTAIVVGVLSIVLCSLFVNGNTPKVTNSTVVNVESNKQYDAKMPFSRNDLNGLNYITFDTSYSNFSSKNIKLSIKDCINGLSINDQKIDLGVLTNSPKMPLIGYCNIERGISIDLSKYAQADQNISVLITTYSLNGNVSGSLIGSDKDWSFTLAMVILNIILIVCLFYIL